MGTEECICPRRGGRVGTLEASKKQACQPYLERNAINRTKPTSSVNQVFAMLSGRVIVCAQNNSLV